MKYVNINQNLLYSTLINSSLEKKEIKKKMITCLIDTRDIEIVRKIVDGIVDNNNYETFLNDDNFSEQEINALLKAFSDDTIEIKNNEKIIKEIKKDVDILKSSIEEIKMVSKELTGDLNPDYIYIKNSTGNMIVIHKSILESE
jgi:hypothetical protein